MPVSYYLVGYDRSTGEAKVYQPLPRAAVGKAKSCAGIPSDPGMIGDWPLSVDAARAIAALAPVTVDPEHLEYCLEPHESMPARASTHAAQ